MKKIDYRIVLIVWLAIGIASTSYFYISPPSEKVSYKDRLLSARGYDFYDSRGGYSWSTRTIYNEKIYKYSLVVTSIGILLIGGLGYLSQKQN